MTEVGLALVLLVGAALLIRTFIALRMVNPGYDTHNVLTMEMALNGDRYEKTAGVAQLVRDSRERIAAIPGVEAVAVTNSLPLQGGFGLPFYIVGTPTTKGPQHRRRGVESDFPRLLRSIQDSHPARPRFYGER